MNGFTSCTDAPVLTRLQLPGREGTRSLHVLTLTPFYPSAENPVRGCFIEEPLRWTAKMGANHHVIAVQPFYKSRVQALNTAVRCEHLRYFSLPGNPGLATTGNFLAAELMGLVSRLHRSTPIDIIHAHAALPCGHAAALIGEKLAIPFVVSVHGLDVFFEEQVGAPWANWCKKACTQVYARASRVICISEKVRSRLPADAARKSAVVYNGVDPEMFSPAAESVSPLTVLSVGNLIAIKDHALLVRAFARSCRDNPNCQLQIIGEGRERGNLVGLTKSLGIHNRTQFLGRQPREAVAEAMKHCAIFALPSRYEGLGCVYLEAMATAKPVLGCRGQGIEDIIEHGKNGLLIHPGDEAEFADALVTLLRSPELRRQLGGNARKTIVQNLTLEHQAQHLMQICRECAA